MSSCCRKKCTMEARQGIEGGTWLLKNSIQMKFISEIEVCLRGLTVTPDTPSEPKKVALETIIPQHRTNNCSLWVQLLVSFPLTRGAEGLDVEVDGVEAGVDRLEASVNGGAELVWLRPASGSSIATLELEPASGTSEIAALRRRLRN